MTVEMLYSFHIFMHSTHLPCRSLVICGFRMKEPVTVSQILLFNFENKVTKTTRLSNYSSTFATASLGGSSIQLQDIRSFLVIGMSFWSLLCTSKTLVLLLNQFGFQFLAQHGFNLPPEVKLMYFWLLTVSLES